MNRRSLRVLGFQFGRSNESPLEERFEELAALADRAGVQWRDLVQEGYRVRGDFFVGGVRMRYDWNWRIQELQRRLDEHN